MTRIKTTPSAASNRIEIRRRLRSVYSENTLSRDLKRIRILQRHRSTLIRKAFEKKRFSNGFRPTRIAQRYKRAFRAERENAKRIIHNIPNATRRLYALVAAIVTSGRGRSTT